MAKIWFTLFILFIVYSLTVYFYCDEKPRPASEHARAGMLVWQSKNCQACHQLYGLGGYMGPDLTNVAQKGKPYMEAFIRSGTPRMPRFDLSNDEVSQLSAFLEWVNSTGESRVKVEEVHWTGTYQLSKHD